VPFALAAFVAGDIGLQQLAVLPGAGALAACAGTALVALAALAALAAPRRCVDGRVLRARAPVCTALLLAARR